MNQAERIEPQLAGRGDPSYLRLLVLLNVGSAGLTHLLAPLTQELSAAFELTTNGVSTVETGFLLVYAIASPVWAYLATRVSRHKALVLCSAIWGGCCLAISLIATRLALQVGFALAAVGTAGILPLTFAMAVDVTPPGRRGQAFGWLFTAQSLSRGLAFAVGGTLGERVGWQVPFQVFSGFAAIAVLLLLCWKRYEPAHGATELELQSLFDAGEVYDPRIHWRDVKLLFSPIANWWYVLANLLAMIPLGAVGFWFIHMMRADHGFSQTDATLLMIGMYLIRVPGAVVVGRISDRLSGRRPLAKPLMLLAAALLTLPCYFIGFLIPWSGEQLGSPGFIGFVTLVTAGAFISCAIPPLTYNCIGEINPPEKRSVLFAMINLAHLIGQMIGIQVASRMAQALFNARLSAGLAWTTILLVPAALCLLPAIRRSIGDRRQLSASLREFVDHRMASQRKNGQGDGDPTARH